MQLIDYREFYFYGHYIHNKLFIVPTYITVTNQK